ncbi:MAG: hypothetical protein IJ617_09105, partial [Oscillospiraceae bacterium]|nr:hypothetical protein [Oscillospiraceae bacterium]
MLKLQKNAVAVTAAALVLGIFGAFLRWLQIMNLYEAETGLPRAGTGTSYLFLLFSAAAMAGLAVLTLFTVPRRVGMSGTAALLAPGKLPVALAWLLCVPAALGGIILMFTAG